MNNPGSANAALEVNSKSAAQTSIQHTYSRLLESSGYRARSGQKRMIAEIAKAMTHLPTLPLVIEAGTGTGKTFAYLTALLPLARQLDKQLVISTATAALQDQLVGKDVPQVAAATGLHPSFALVKGRQRYLCRQNLDRSLGRDSAQVDYFGGARTLTRYSLETFRQLDRAVADGSWDGDRDHWPEQIPDNDWGMITSDRRSCGAARCQWFSDCAFYAARADIETADCLIVNHDLVLADAVLGGGVILPAPENAFWVFDEAHVFQERARQHLSRYMSTRFDPIESQAALDACAAGLPQESETRALQRCLHELRDGLIDAAQGIQVFDEILAAEFGLQSGALHRFREGILPEPIAASVKVLLPQVERVTSKLKGATDELERISATDNRDLAVALQNTAVVLGNIAARTDSWSGLLESWNASGGNTFARWIKRHRSDGHDLYAAPIDVSAELHNMMWERAGGLVLTSATMSIGGDFSLFQASLGLPPETTFETIESPFDYARQGALDIYTDAPDARNDEEFDSYLATALAQILDPAEGTLVLFGSIRQQESVREKLDSIWIDRILMQGVLSRQEILQRHRERIDRGEGSIIFGLKSFSEGVDLKGSYCSHLIITRIPFAVPDDPVEATISERIKARGGDPFRELALPSAAMRLIQATGRLIRSDQDEGRVSVLDSRLARRNYSAYLIAALPPFRVSHTKLVKE